MKAVVSEKGQVTIPKKLRDSMGIRAGQVLDFEEDSGKLVARKLSDAEFEAGLARVWGILSDEYAGKDTDQILAELRGYTRDELILPEVPGESE